MASNNDNHGVFEGPTPQVNPDMPGGGKGYATLSAVPKISAQPLTAGYTFRIFLPNVTITGKNPGHIIHTLKYNPTQFSERDSTVKQLFQQYQNWTITKNVVDITTVGPMATSSGSLLVSFINDPTLPVSDDDSEMLKLMTARSETITINGKQNMSFEPAFTNNVLTTNTRFCYQGANSDERLTSFGTFLLGVGAVPTAADSIMVQVLFTINIKFTTRSYIPMNPPVVTPSMSLSIKSPGSHGFSDIGEVLMLTATITNGFEPKAPLAGTFFASPALTRYFVIYAGDVGPLQVQEALTLTITSCAFVYDETTKQVTITIDLPKVRAAIVRNPDGVTFSDFELNGQVYYTATGTEVVIPGVPISTSSQTHADYIRNLNALDMPQDMHNRATAAIADRITQEIRDSQIREHVVNSPFVRVE